MRGYVESDMRRKIIRAYHQLTERFPEEALRVPPWSLLDPSPDITADLVFKPRARFIAAELRRLFSGEEAALVAAVLHFTREQQRVVHESEQASGLLSYGIDSLLGPYRLLTPKKSLLRRRVQPSRTLVSLEEVCLKAEDPKEVYRAVYILIGRAVAVILEGEG